MFISFFLLLLIEGFKVGGGDIVGFVGVKVGILNGSILDWEGFGEENGLVDIVKEIIVKCNIYIVKIG